MTRRGDDLIPKRVFKKPVYLIIVNNVPRGKVEWHGNQLMWTDHNGVAHVFTSSSLVDLRDKIAAVHLTSPANVKITYKNKERLSS
jgi:hypothetical protein